MNETRIKSLLNDNGQARKPAKFPKLNGEETLLQMVKKFSDYTLKTHGTYSNEEVLKAVNTFLGKGISHPFDNVEAVFLEGFNAANEVVNTYFKELTQHDVQVAFEVEGVDYASAPIKRRMKNELILVSEKIPTTKMGCHYSFRRMSSSHDVYRYFRGVRSSYICFLKIFYDFVMQHDNFNEEISRNNIQEVFNCLAQGVCMSGKSAKDLWKKNPTRYIIRVGNENWKKAVNFVLEKIHEFSNVERNFSLQESYEIKEKKDRAGVFEYKKHISEKAQTLNENSSFLSHGFTFLDVDTDTDTMTGQTFDSDSFETIEKEWQRIYPHLIISPNTPSLHFRKLGNFKAAGLYSPALNGIAVDVRIMSSFLHEYGHHIDYTLGDGMLSLQEDFQSILIGYQENAKNDENLKGATGKYDLSYFTTPTEVFARAFEVYLILKGLDTSFLQKKEAYAFLPQYKCFDTEIKKDVERYFDTLFALQGKDITNAFRPVEKSEFAAGSFVGEQLSLF